MSNNAHELSNRLLNALDNNYNVIDMHAVNEIISILERINITKELLETTRLGKHVNELRRKTSDPSLARRAKVLVKRWRDLVIPARASPAHTGSNRSSAERQVRRLGGTPLTSPALSRVLSPAVNSPRPPSRPAWGGYESDSQDVILVDDDPPPAPAQPPPPPRAPHVPQPVKRPLSPEPVHDEKKAKRDKKPKKRRGHSRAGVGTESAAAVAGAVAVAGAGAGGGAWAARNGTPHPDTRRNGCRKPHTDPYAALVNKIPQPGAKKVKTTKELLEQIQSRGSKAVPSPGSPVNDDDDVVVVDDPIPVVKVDSPLRNGRAPSPPAPAICPPLEDPREYVECTCGAEAGAEAEAGAGAVCGARGPLRPGAVRALHHAYLPGVNGTRAPHHPHQYARRPARADTPGLFASVVPLYNYSDYADDYCVKNMDRVPLARHLPWTEFAPAPPSPPPPKSPPPLRPYPVDDEEESARVEVKVEPKTEVKYEYECPPIEAEMVSVPTLEPSERLKAPLLLGEDAAPPPRARPPRAPAAAARADHRTVERTKVDLDGRTLYELCASANKSVPFNYGQTSAAPVVTLPQDGAEAERALAAALQAAAADSAVDELGRPPRPDNFTEWHECAKLGDLIALPYVVID